MTKKNLSIPAYGNHQLVEKSSYHVVIKSVSAPVQYVVQ